MRKLILIAVLFSFFTPHVFAQAPELTVDGKSNNGVYLQTLKIEIKVCGTVARTAWQMTFKNTTDRILEGNLNFPLKDGISVSRYALDISGKMREAVPVDRGKGTAVFETIERRRVDPGLLEKLDGNVFRTRIYPIVAHGTRTVIIGYDEELPLLSNASLQYHLPLAIKDIVKEFSLDISVIQSSVKPVFDTALNENIVFDKTGNVYTASFKRTDYMPAASLSFSIPKPTNASEVMLQPFENRYCYLVNTQVQQHERKKAMPRQISLLWDASLSGTGRNTQKEIDFLDAYFKNVNTAVILFQSFNKRPGEVKRFALQNGNWDLLREELEEMVYDGATNLSNLDLKNFEADECILVSDGRQTAGSKPVQTGNKPVYCVNSAAGADYSLLKLISIKTGAVLIDLQKDDVPAALKKISTEPYLFLGVANKTDITESYPSLPVAVSGNFAIAGIANEGAQKIVLQFGYGNKVSEERTIWIDAENQLCTDFDITRIYAQKKIAELDISYDKNKTEIERLGKQFGIVTRNTSLIVLETLNDYLQYEIEPPAEFQEEYQRFLKGRGENVITQQQDNFERSLDMIEILKNWYGYEEKNATAHANDDSSSLRRRLISGKVTDVNGNAVPFANILIRKKKTGVVADARGMYTIRVQGNELLEISALGYITNLVSVQNQKSINTVLQRSANVTDLREVVVTTAYNLKKKADDMSYAAQGLKSDKLARTNLLPGVNNALQGKIAGVQIRTETESALGAASKIRLRGVTNFDEKSALILVNGVPVDDINSINASDIGDVNVLKGPSATSVYGQRAANGVLMITTKDFMPDSAYKSTQEKIPADEKMPAGINILYNPETTDYLKMLRQISKEMRYDKYLEMRPSFMNKPTYFFDVAGYFLKTGERETGLLILSDLAELENANYELYKMLGYKLKEAGDYEGEMEAFKKVLELRPLDPQSYRDYALALEDMGRYQEALDLLYEGMIRSYSNEMNRMYRGIEEIFLTEINRLIALHKTKLDLTRVDRDLIAPLPTDVRIVMNWNKNNTDIDLWVTDPDGEKCFYAHAATAAGGRISDDFTEGFGPEQFMLKKGKPGKYRIAINYYSDRQVTIAGPTTVMAEIYLHYGTAREEKKIITLQMKKGAGGEVYIGEVEL